MFLENTKICGSISISCYHESMNEKHAKQVRKWAYTALFSDNSTKSMNAAAHILQESARTQRRARQMAIKKAVKKGVQVPGYLESEINCATV